jgi:hypothetical protein
MEEFLIQHEPTIRLALLVGVFGCIALWDAHLPRRRQRWSRGLCWANNHGLRLVDSLLLPPVFPLAAVGMAIEILLSMLIKLLVILALGAPVVVVLVFEIILDGMAMFNLANLRIRRRVDAVLHRLLVTPEMHQGHPCSVTAETDGNFGGNLSIWDPLFGTSRAHSATGHEAMTTGIPLFRHRRDLWLDHFLLIPFPHAVVGSDFDGRTA